MCTRVKACTEERRARKDSKRTPVPKRKDREEQEKEYKFPDQVEYPTPEEQEELAIAQEEHEENAAVEYYLEGRVALPDRERRQIIVANLRRRRASNLLKHLYERELTGSATNKGRPQQKIKARIAEYHGSARR